MADLVISSLSKETVRAKVSGTASGSSVDPQTYTVEIAFTTGAEPASGDWKAATWDVTTGPPAVYRAQLVVGPGSTDVLADGTYTMWVRVTTPTEQPVKRSGTVVVT